MWGCIVKYWELYKCKVMQGCSHSLCIIYKRSMSRSTSNIWIHPSFHWKPYSSSLSRLICPDTMLQCAIFTMMPSYNTHTFDSMRRNVVIVFRVSTWCTKECFHIMSFWTSVLTLIQDALLYIHVNIATMKIIERYIEIMAHDMKLMSWIWCKL